MGGRRPRPRRLHRIESHAHSCDWDPEWIQRIGPSYAAHTSEYRVVDLWEDPESGLLWVRSSGPDPDRSPATEAPSPTQSLSPAFRNARYDNVVSVFDPVRGQVLAHLVIEDAGFQFLEDGRLILMGEADDGYQWVEVLTFRLVGYLDH